MRLMNGRWANTCGSNGGEKTVFSTLHDAPSQAEWFGTSTVKQWLLQDVERLWSVIETSLGQRASTFGAKMEFARIEQPHRRKEWRDRVSAMTAKGDCVVLMKSMSAIE